MKRCSWTSFPRPRKWCGQPCWSCTASTLACRTAPESSCSSLATRIYKVRETAEAKLRELGPVAVPVLEDALINKDVEIVFRAERLLLRLNRSVP